MAAESSFLFKSNFGEDTIHNVYKSHLVSRRRIPMTACPSYKLTQVTKFVTMNCKYDEDQPRKVLLLAKKRGQRLRETRF